MNYTGLKKRNESKGFKVKKSGQIVLRPQIFVQINQNGIMLGVRVHCVRKCIRNVIPP